MSKKDPTWYLKLLSPGLELGWVDPPSMYMKAEAFQNVIDDLTEPFSPDEIDLVVGVEPFGFVLGAGIAARLGKGFLPIRVDKPQAGPKDVADFAKKSGETGKLEMRNPAFHPGTRVLLVDQWVESGGAMRGALELVKRQNAVVAGIATLCIEENTANANLRSEYKCATVVIPGTDFQRQCNQKKLDHCENFDWYSILPELTK